MAVQDGSEGVPLAEFLGRLIGSVGYVGFCSRDALAVHRSAAGCRENVRGLNIGASSIGVLFAVSAGFSCHVVCAVWECGRPLPFDMSVCVCVFALSSPRLFAVFASRLCHVMSVVPCGSAVARCLAK